LKRDSTSALGQSNTDADQLAVNGAVG